MSFSLIYSWYHLLYFSLALQVLNALENHHFKFKLEEFYMCTSSAVYLSSVFGGYTETDMQIRGAPAEIASLHQHTECVYLGNPNIQQ